MFDENYNKSVIDWLSILCICQQASSLSSSNSTKVNRGGHEWDQLPSSKKLIAKQSSPTTTVFGIDFVFFEGNENE